MEIDKKLLTIQQKLKAPKNQHNAFGNFNYRSCEDILEAVKPLLAEVSCVLTMSDQVLYIGERYYIQAIATLTDVESGETKSSTGYAREEAEKKGMDGSQITGAASSYARKYCLNALFLIDDNKDADTNEAHEQQAKAPEKKLAAAKVNALLKKCEKDKVPVEFICSAYKVKSLYQLTETQYKNCIECWDQVKEGANGKQGQAN